MISQGVFFILDGDDVGKAIEAGIIAGEPESVAWISPKIQAGIDGLMKRLTNLGGKILLRGGDDILGILPKTSVPFLKEIPEIFLAETGFSVSVGVGSSAPEAFLALKLAKSQGKKQCVVWAGSHVQIQR